MERPLKQKSKNSRCRQLSTAKNTVGSFFAPTYIQAKLTVNAPNDIYEKEADAVADQVMRMPDSANPVQRKCKHCEDEEKMQRKPLTTNISPLVQRKLGNEGNAVNSQVVNALQASKGGGRPLPHETRSFMESRFGADFGHVNIHTSSNAVQLSRNLNAQAFTHGSDVYFNEGKFAPETSGGKRLLAHELTHVVQQQGNNRVEMAQRVCGRENDTTVSDFPNTYINHIDVDVSNPAEVRLTWTGPNASSGARGPFHATIGNGKGIHNCDDVTVSNDGETGGGTNCTPKGDFTIERQACALSDYPDAENASYFDSDRGIAFHYWRHRPNCPASHGCVRLERAISELIYDNCISDATSDNHGKPATTVHVGGTWSLCED